MIHKFDAPCPLSIFFLNILCSLLLVKEKKSDGNLNYNLHTKYSDEAVNCYTIYFLVLTIMIVMIKNQWHRQEG